MTLMSIRQAMELLKRVGLRSGDDWAPDLEIHVTTHRAAGRITLTYRLQAGDSRLDVSDFGPVELERDPQQYFKEFFRDISDEITQENLENKGSGLAKLLPEDLRQELWRLQGTVQTVRIHSAEAWIPWELLKLEGREEGERVRGAFLGEAFAVTRSLKGRPGQRYLPLRNLALVVTSDSQRGTSEGLPEAGAEAEYLESLQQRGREVHRIPANRRAVIDGLKQGEYDGWHFIGHGVTGAEDPDQWLIPMQTHSDGELMPEDLLGPARDLGRASPLVFLNCCHSARGARSLIGVGGWASRFLEADAGAFIGTYWATADKPAREFAESFYRSFLQGIPIAEAVRQARLAVRARFPDDPTWLAYTAFAHPRASCRRISPPNTCRRLLRRGCWAFWLVVLLTAALWAWQLRREHSTQQWREALAHNNQGIELMQDGRFDAAREAFSDALARDPRLVEAISNLADLDARAGKVQAAVEGYRRAIALEPEKAVYHYNLGNLLAGLGRYEEALEPLGRALEIAPDYLEAYNELGNAYLKLERPADARRMLEAGLAHDPGHAPLNKNLARALLAEGMATAARGYLETALHQYEAGDSGRLEATYLLAEAHALLGDQEESCRQLHNFRGYPGSAVSPWEPAAVELAARNGCEIERLHQ